MNISYMIGKLIGKLFKPKLSPIKFIFATFFAYWFTVYFGRFIWFCFTEGLVYLSVYGIVFLVYYGAFLRAKDVLRLINGK
jgi:CDP-diglyceride synthetase